MFGGNFFAGSLVVSVIALGLGCVNCGVQDAARRTTSAAGLLTERPKWLTLCRKADPKLSDCLLEMFHTMFPELAKGIPEINVDHFEPLHINRVSVTKGTGPVTLAGSLFNMTVRGPSGSIPTYANMDLSKNKFDFGIDIPLLDIRSQYNLKGKILVLPLVGHGQAELRLTAVSTKISTNVAFPKVEGRPIMKIEKMHVDFTVGGMKIKLHNLFNGNKVLGLTVNNFLNQNALEIISELNDSLGESLAAIFTELMNKIYEKIPIDLWLVDGDVPTDEPETTSDLLTTELPSTAQSEDVHHEVEKRDEVTEKLR